MNDLENVFGEEFADEYRQEIAKRREERVKVDEDVKMEASHKAINDGKFKEGDPQFSITTESDITHDVLLMQLPDIEGKSIFGFTNELDTGAITCPLDYMGEWMSCLFNDADDLREMEEGEHYIVIGQLDQWENDQGEMNDQVSPVRGVLSLQEAKEMADKFLDGEVNESGSSVEDVMGEDESESRDSEADEKDDELSGFLSEGDEEEDEDEEEYDVPYDAVANIVEIYGEKEEAVWDLEEGDDRLDKLTKLTINQLDLDEDTFDEVKEHALTRIDDENEEEESSEEDKMF